MTRLKSSFPIVVRVVLSGLFMYSVACSLLGIKPPIPAGTPAEEFTKALAATGYMIPLLKIAELGAAILLLRKRFVPLGLVLAAPVVVNIAAFHLFLEHGGLPIAGVLAAGVTYLAILHGAAFRPLVAPRTPPVNAAMGVPANAGVRS
jgi:hypothetical protein